MKIVIKAGAVAALCVYLMILTKMILFKYMSFPEIISHFTFKTEGAYWNQNNFIPFKTILYYLFMADINTNIRIENLVGNIIGFMPLGFLLPIISKKFYSLKRVAFAAFFLSSTFEIIQIIFKFGSFDVDDLILNTVGGIAGCLPVFLFLRVYKKNQGFANRIAN